MIPHSIWDQAFHRRLYDLEQRTHNGTLSEPQCEQLERHIDKRMRPWRRLYWQRVWHGDREHARNMHGTLCEWLVVT